MSFPNLSTQSMWINSGAMLQKLTYASKANAIPFVTIVTCLWLSLPIQTILSYLIWLPSLRGILHRYLTTGICCFTSLLTAPSSDPFWIIPQPPMVSSSTSAKITNCMPAGKHIFSVLSSQLSFPVSTLQSLAQNQIQSPSIVLLVFDLSLVLK